METRTRILENNVKKVIEVELDKCIERLNGSIGEKIDIYKREKQRFSQILSNFFKQKKFELYGTETKLIGSDLGLIVDIYSKEEKRFKKLFIKLESITRKEERKIKENEATAFKLLGKSTAIEQHQENIGDLNITYTEKFSNNCSDLVAYIMAQISDKLNKLKEKYRIKWKEAWIAEQLSGSSSEKTKAIEEERDAKIKELYMQAIKDLANNEIFRKDIFNIANKSLFLGLLDIRGQNIVIDEDIKRARIVDFQRTEVREENGDFDDFDYFIDKLEIKKFEPVSRFERELLVKENGIARFIVDLFALSETNKNSGSMLAGATLFEEGSLSNGYLYDMLIELLNTPDGEKEFMESISKTVNELLDSANKGALNQKEREELIASLNRIIKINEIIKINFEGQSIIDRITERRISRSIDSLSFRIDKSQSATFVDPSKPAFEKMTAENIVKPISEPSLSRSPRTKILAYHLKKENEKLARTNNVREPSYGILERSPRVHRDHESKRVPIKQKPIVTKATNKSSNLPKLNTVRLGF